MAARSPCPLAPPNKWVSLLAHVTGTWPIYSLRLDCFRDRVTVNAILPRSGRMALPVRVAFFQVNFVCVRGRVCECVCACSCVYLCVHVCYVVHMCEVAFVPSADSCDNSLPVHVDCVQNTCYCIVTCLV